jgi:hypothetical protein
MYRAHLPVSFKLFTALLSSGAAAHTVCPVCLDDNNAVNNLVVTKNGTAIVMVHMVPIVEVMVKVTSW